MWTSLQKPFFWKIIGNEKDPRAADIIIMYMYRVRLLPVIRSDLQKYVKVRVFE